jgi:hypothetical protein
VDVPHLLLRMPFLLGARADSLDSWTHQRWSEAPHLDLKRPFSKSTLPRIYLGVTCGFRRRHFGGLHSRRMKS